MNRQVNRWLHCGRLNRLIRSDYGKYIVSIRSRAYHIISYPIPSIHPSSIPDQIRSDKKKAEQSITKLSIQTSYHIARTRPLSSSTRSPTPLGALTSCRYTCRWMDSHSTGHFYLSIYLSGVNASHVHTYIDRVQSHRANSHHTTSSRAGSSRVKSSQVESSQSHHIKLKPQDTNNQRAQA
jgi:hypothetical protein